VVGQIADGGVRGCGFPKYINFQVWGVSNNKLTLLFCSEWGRVRGCFLWDMRGM